MIHPKIKENASFIFAFLLMLIYLMVKTKFGNSFSFDGAVDANENWKIAHAMANNYVYHSYVEYRGYMWTSILSVFHLLAKYANLNPISFLNIFNAAIFAGLTTKALPFLFEITTKEKISTVGKVLFPLVIFYFFRNHFLYPLTDFISFYLTVSSINYLFKYRNSTNIKALLISSVLISCAFLIRGNYKLTALVELFILIYFIQKGNWKTILKSILVFIIPITFFYYSNSLYTKKLNLHATEIGVLVAQLNRGLNIQKIDPIMYKNNIGIRLLEKNGYNLNHIFTVKEYLIFVLNNPMDFALVYTQNLFNGLDIKDNTVYFANNSNTISLFSFINYSILFFGFFVILYRINAKIFNSVEILSFMLILFPTIITVSFGMEPRYLMPLTIFFYIYSIFGLRLKHLKLIRYNVLIALYIAFILNYFLFSIKTYLELFY